MADRSQQLDLYQHSPERMAQAYRVAAETALHDPFFPPEEQRWRHDYYAAQALLFEQAHGRAATGPIARLINPQPQFRCASSPKSTDDAEAKNEHLR